jgi:hypothetical protein
MIEEEVTPFGFINNGEEQNQLIDAGGQVWQVENYHKSDFL